MRAGRKEARTGNVGGDGGLEAGAAGVAPDAAAHDEGGGPERAEVAGRGGARGREERAQRRGEEEEEEGRAEGRGHRARRQHVTGSGGEGRGGDEMAMQGGWQSESVCGGVEWSRGRGGIMVASRRRRGSRGGGVGWRGIMSACGGWTRRTGR